MKPICLLLTAMLLLGGIGCASTDDTADAAFEAAPAWTQQPADLAAAVLFDRRPGWYRASDFAFRSDWPSTDAFYSPGQVIYFSERFVDIQGRRFGESDYTYRRFDTARVGIGYR